MIREGFSIRKLESVENAEGLNDDLFAQWFGKKVFRKSCVTRDNLARLFS